MKRTGQQNKSLHLYCELLAEAMDSAGMDMRQVIKVPIQPTKENVKETMWRPIQKALYPEVESTTDLDSAQVSQVYENLNRATAEKLGISVEFPSEERLYAEMMRKRENK